MDVGLTRCLRSSEPRRERERERVLDAYVNQQYGVDKILPSYIRRARPSLRVTRPTLSLSLSRPLSFYPRVSVYVLCKNIGYVDRFYFDFPDQRLFKLHRNLMIPVYRVYQCFDYRLELDGIPCGKWTSWFKLNGKLSTGKGSFRSESRIYRRSRIAID